MDKKEAYEIVLNDLMSDNAPGLFKGRYDAVHGNESFMYGISTVIEFIAHHVSNKAEDKYSNLFMNNMVKSEEKALQIKKDNLQEELEI